MTQPENNKQGKQAAAPCRNALARELFRMTWPMLFGVLSLMSFQLADSAFIGQLGVLPLAAQGFTVPMYQLVIGFQVGLGIATTAVISRALGAKDQPFARLLAGAVVLLGAVLIGLLCLLIWFLRDLILRGLGAGPEVYPAVAEYWSVWLPSAWVGAMVYFGYSISRANGNTLLPGWLMVFTSLLNIVLDPIFIFVFEFGLPGAAMATLLSFTLGGLIVYPKVLQHGWLLIQWQRQRLMVASRRLLHIMAPAMLSQLLPSISALLATALLASYGESAVGAWGLGTRFEFFSIVIVLALTMSMPPMVGRLLGKQDFQSIRTLVNMAVIFVLGLQALIGVIWWVSAEPLSELFSSDVEITNILALYIQTMPLSYGPLGVCILMVSVNNALGLPMRALLTSLFRLFLCYLPFLWLGSHFYGLSGVFWGGMVGNCVAGFMAWSLYKQGIRLLSNKEKI
ncbi:MATE efflux family protein [Oleiphilus messinensis]|uniref:MATE efflux family protein n=1 Tax=Oleiphilus messinensis TaxID=141451 RepID=A0A1Y0I8K0_9GAMM|nr:MATE family efflux transporter [Oleiphilus messinensis]ARU55764.1 MATE efflux family protein [Oleiphilus messinensis]